MKISTPLILSAVAIALAACSTTDRSSSARIQKRFAQADINRDGKITRQEYGYSMIEEAFARYDKNRNGSITLDEFVALGGSPASFRKIDKNGNGVITLEEAKNAKIAMDAMTVAFYGADTDKDGYVTLQEALAYREAARAYTR
ncbi:MAG: hypothetical protein Fur0032_20330 [Terrimicrobiaceae bacterium]